MNGLRIGVVAAVIATASYGLACAAEVSAASTAAARAARAVQAPTPPARLGKLLAAARGQGQAATRGAKEAGIYRTAAPSVVMVVTEDGVGSGALISADGKIVTNLHVIGDEDFVSVIFKPGDDDHEVTAADARPAKVLRRDGVTDLALIQVKEPPAGVSALPIAKETLPVGSDVHAIGHPDGETWTYTRGIISQVRRDYAWHYDDGVAHQATVIQTQTPINPGNSGGPLLDDAGEVMGLNTFSGEGEGINFAVSAADIRALLDMTADREAVGGKAGKVSKTSAEACEGVVISQTHDKKARGVYSILDSDCNGKSDSMLFTPDNKRATAELAIDSDEDGELDQWFMDRDRDESFEIGDIDTDSDGKADLRQYYKPGEDEPYRIERIEP